MKFFKICLILCQKIFCDGIVLMVQWLQYLYATDDKKKTEHLLALDGAKERLHLFKADLLEEGSFDSLVDGSIAVFHTASPFYHNPNDPQVHPVSILIPVVVIHQLFSEVTILLWWNFHFCKYSTYIVFSAVYQKRVWYKLCNCFPRFSCGIVSFKDLYRWIYHLWSWFLYTNQDSPYP